MRCYLCDGTSISTVNGTVRDMPQNKVLECQDCGLVFLESFSHISDNFYENSGMYEGEHNPKQELRLAHRDDKRRFDYTKDLVCDKDVLDFGCGYGGYLSMIEPHVNSCDGVELNQHAKEEFSERNVCLYGTIEEIPTEKKYDVITLFHVLEHLTDPRSTLKSLSNHLKEDGSLIIEVPNSRDALLSIYGSEAFSKFTYWSCHLMLFDNKNLPLLFKQSGFKEQYIKQIQRYPLSNHLYWLTNEKPGGHKELDFLNCSILHDAYEKKLASVGCCDTIIAKIKKVQDVA